ncbi:subtilisin-like protease SBT4.4 [Ziziphus jujuba]|uniref:Subtilisin-like protease SBT4.4 n=1 Tax=Ziziphus jujuba TaxID=326968 RepID=A0A6P6GK49_ZIZJJ|nr:subtilisin-like protease SBT4.4 [Ziziphus jujuba]
MAKYGYSLMFYRLMISIFILSSSLRCKAIDNDDRKVYIVYMGSLPDDALYSPTANHISLLQGVLQGSSVENSLITSYKRSFNGFAAKLTDTERQRIAEMKEVVSVFPSRNLKLQTTRSWDFIGLHQKAKRNPTAESNIIVGVIDSGVWPESDSFSDKGFGPPPKKWKGVCSGGDNFTCNNKLIGARFYQQSLIKKTTTTARDTEGHGSHTASTAAGNIVNGVTFFGIVRGAARGGVPSARIAVYKACDGGCFSASILAAFDDAIADGVDIITISIGADSPLEYDQDPIAIGAFHGLKRGILTINSAGNSGSSLGSVSSVAPWMMTVAASSTDRRIIDKVVLGNGKTLIGNTVNTFTMNQSFPLVYGKDVTNGVCVENDTRSCVELCINQTAVKGKILLCDRPPLAEALTNATGSIYNKLVSSDTPFVEAAPTSGLTPEDYTTVQTYFNSTKNAHANILKSEVITDSAAPRVASFSSRGPNLITREILKPDITAPGIDILAAFSPLASPSSFSGDLRRVKYNIVSGTSMSCPHVAGAAAYVKSFHPDWSPSAIKSSLMTTAWVMNSTQSFDSEFGYGAGHVNPVKAIDPGLVYENSQEDYINFLCGIGYTEDRIRLIYGEYNSTCHKVSVEPKNFNYPAFVHQVVEDDGSFSVDYKRRVKNVGLANSTYKAKFSPNSKLEMKVEPEVLSFKFLNEEKAFNVTVTGVVESGTIQSSSIIWSDGTHSVRTPIVIFKPIPS